MTDAIEVLPAPDGKIDADGIYDLPNERYHGDCAIGPSISSTGLRQFEQKSPAHYFMESRVLNPDAGREESKNLNFGAAAHCLLLEPEKFRQDFTLAPFKNYNTNETIDGVEYKARIPKSWKPGDTPPEGVIYKPHWKAMQIEAGKTVVEQKDIDTIRGMRDVLEKEPLVMQGLMSIGAIEKSLLWRDPEATAIAYETAEDPDGDDSPGIWLKSRPDQIPLDDCLVDFKTTADARPEKLERTIGDYGYHMQMATAAEGIWRILGKEITSFTLIFQEKDPPYPVTVAEIPHIDIWRAYQQNRRALREFAACVRLNDWPFYTRGRVAQIGLNGYMRYRLANEQSAGTLPDVTPPFLHSKIKDFL